MRPRDPVRELAVAIVNIFSGLLRDEELRDAYREVRREIETHLPMLKEKSDE